MDFSVRMACKGRVSHVCRLIFQKSEFKQGSVCFPARKPFNNVEVVNVCL